VSTGRVSPKRGRLAFMAGPHGKERSLRPARGPAKNAARAAKRVWIWPQAFAIARLPTAFPDSSVGRAFDW